MESSDKLTDKQAGPATTGSGVQIDRSETVEVSIDQIHSSKLMLRPADENCVHEISKSMASIGLVEPILVRPLVGGGFEVVDGHHRLLAATKLGWATIRCRIVPMDDGRAFQTAEAAHILRNHNVNPIAEAFGFDLLRKQGLSEEKIGQSIGKSQQYVSARLVLLRLEPPIQAMVTSGLVKAEHAYELVRVDDPRKRKVLAEMARTNQPQPLTLIEVRELAKASWPELYENERAKAILLDDPAECARYAAARLERFDQLVHNITLGEVNSIDDWVLKRHCVIERLERELHGLTGPSVWKREHCVNYDGDICSQWEWEHDPSLVYLPVKQVGNKWKLRVSQSPERCATCPLFQEKPET